MDNVKLSGLLNEAAELLAADSIETLTEVTASTDEGKKLVKEVEDAIKEKDEAKLKKAVPVYVRSGKNNPIHFGRQFERCTGSGFIRL